MNTQQLGDSDVHFSGVGSVISIDKRPRLGKKTSQKYRTFSSGRWTTEEHNNFLEGLKLYGKIWKKIQILVPTRSTIQIRTHAQKYFLANGKSEHLSSDDSFSDSHDDDSMTGMYRKRSLSHDDEFEDSSFKMRKTIHGEFDVTDSDSVTSDETALAITPPERMQSLNNMSHIFDPVERTELDAANVEGDFSVDLGGVLGFTDADFTSAFDLLFNSTEQTSECFDLGGEFCDLDLQCALDLSVIDVI